MVRLIKDNSCTSISLSFITKPELVFIGEKTPKVAWKCYFSAFLGNYDWPTDQPSDQPTHDVTLPKSIKNIP